VLLHGVGGQIEITGSHVSRGTLAHSHCSPRDVVEVGSVDLGSRPQGESSNPDSGQCSEAWATRENLKGAEDYPHRRAG